MQTGPWSALERKAMKVLVTGGTGFIGRHCVAELLHLGHDVTILSRSKHTIHARANIVVSDMTDPTFPAEAICDGGYDALIHLAWETRHGYFWTAPENDVWLAASKNLFTAFLENGGNYIIVAGTCVEYDPPREGPCIAGETPLAPTLPYGVAKHELRLALENLAHEHQTDWAWGRIFLATGPNEPENRLVPSIVRSILLGQPAKTSSGIQVRDIMHTSDYGKAFAHLLTNRFKGEINLCRGVPVRLADISRTIGKLMRRPGLIEIGALEDRAGEPQNLWGDARPLKIETGFEPGFELDEMLQDAIDWWRERQSQ